jgi:hypothetical protein
MKKPARKTSPRSSQTPVGKKATTGKPTRSASMSQRAKNFMEGGVTGYSMSSMKISKRK